MARLLQHDDRLVWLGIAWGCGEFNAGFEGLSGLQHRRERGAFARATDGSVWHDYFNTTTGWSGWGSLGAPSGATLVSNVTVGYNPGGNEELFALDSQGNVWHDYFNTTTGWSGWGSLGAPSSATLTDDVAVGTNSSGNEELFALGSDGSVWHDFFNTTTGWSGWGSLGAPSGATLRVERDRGLQPRRERGAVRPRLSRQRLA